MTGALKLLGFRADVPRLLQGIDLFCHPAYREGFGYVIVEAMAAGRPVVVSNTSNLPELVTDDEVGYLRDPNQGVDWTEIIGMMLANRSLADRLGRELDEVDDYFSSLKKPSII